MEICLCIYCEYAWNNVSKGRDRINEQTREGERERASEIVFRIKMNSKQNTHTPRQ